MVLLGVIAFDCISAPRGVETGCGKCCPCSFDMKERGLKHGGASALIVTKFTYYCSSSCFLQFCASTLNISFIRSTFLGS